MGRGGTVEHAACRNLVEPGAAEPFIQQFPRLGLQLQERKLSGRHSAAAAPAAVGASDATGGMHQRAGALGADPQKNGWSQAGGGRRRKNGDDERGWHGHLDGQCAPENTEETPKIKMPSSALQHQEQGSARLLFLRLNDVDATESAWNVVTSGSEAGAMVCAIRM